MSLFVISFAQKQTESFTTYIGAANLHMTMNATQNAMRDIFVSR